MDYLFYFFMCFKYWVMKYVFKKWRFAFLKLTSRRKFIFINSKKNIGCTRVLLQTFTEKKKKQQPVTNIVYLGNVCISARILDLYLFISDVFTVFTMFNAAPKWKQGELNMFRRFPNLFAVCYNTSFTTNHEICHPLWKYEIHIT